MKTIMRKAKKIIAQQDEYTSSQYKLFTRY